MPDDELLTIQEVVLTAPIEQIILRLGLRINCDVCGEEIMNAREVLSNGMTLCRACAGNAIINLP